MPEVSVIIPFYNRVEWVKEAVESVLTQTYTDYEIILVDDGSTEEISSVEVFASRDNVRLIHQKNQGPAAARNTGIKEARGNYIAFLDADDLFRPEKLAVQIEVMKTHPDAVMVHTSYQRFEQPECPLEVMHSGRFQASFPEIYDGCPIATPTVMVKKKVLDRVGGFNPEIRIAEDVLLWARIAKEGRVIGIDQPLTLVRLHGSNAATDYRTQIIGESNIIYYGLFGNPHIHWFQKRKLASIKFLNIAAYYLYYRDYKNACKNLILSLLQHPRRGLGYIFHLSLHIPKAILRKVYLELGRSFGSRPSKRDAR